MRMRRWPVVAVVLAALLAGCGRTSTRQEFAAMPFREQMPARVVWAWEEPEDLRSLDAERVGVAVLVETLRLGDQVRVEARHQPVRLPAGTRVMAVVRVEAERGFQDGPELRQKVAQALEQVSGRPGIQALQVDFDAVDSQHAFYSAVLQQVRRTLPPAMPLSMTALVSWCGVDRWVAALPVTEAVPMWFRMGGPKAHGRDARNPMRGSAEVLGDPMLAPVCRGSVGVSTDERWPQIRNGQRVYLFSPEPWTAGELRRLNQLEFGTARADGSRGR